jgi:maltose operon periplasmic protein
MRSLLFLFGVLVFIQGCATGPMNATGTFLPPEHNQKLAQTKLCCASYRDMKYAKLTLGQETTAALTLESPVFEFPNGRSFFAAFELPANSRAIILKTYPVNMLYNRTGHVLIPAVHFLDAGHQVVATLKPPYVARNPLMIGNSWGEAEVLIPGAARYIVLLDSKSPDGLAWRDMDQRSGFLPVRSGPTGEMIVLAKGG